MSCNVKCVPVRSRWVRQFILTADCELAIWFKNGFCCVYPNTTEALFNLAIIAPSPGHFIWQFLYKIMPYRRIRPPCPAPGGVQTTCCGSANQLPHTLHATVDNGGGTVALTYDGSQYWTASGIALTCGAAVGFRLACNAGGTTAAGMGMDYTCNGGANWQPMALDVLSATCNPLFLPYTVGMSMLVGCGSCSGTFLNATVTQ